jgi:hypothetical protein
MPIACRLISRCKGHTLNHFGRKVKTKILLYLAGLCEGPDRHAMTIPDARADRAAKRSRLRPRNATSS